MKHTALTCITACLIAALCVMAEAACSSQINAGLAAQTATQAATVQPVSAASGQPPEGSITQEVTGTGLYNLSGGEVSKSNEALAATADDQSAVIVSGGSALTMSGMKISSTGSTSSMDSSSLYGLNAAVLAKTGSAVTLSNSTVSTTGTGANGVFAAGEGAKIELNIVTINCGASGARGAVATLGGTLILSNVNITTAEDGAAAVANNSSINVTGSALAAGKNYGVYIYRSMSGSADTGSGAFTMTGGSLTAAEGPLFYSTNTTAAISLKYAALSGTGMLLKAEGAQVTLNADSQKMSGDVALDDLSSVNISLQNGSSLAGAVNSAKTAKSVTLTLDAGSAWNVTADSYLTSLADADGTLSNITGNRHTVYYDSANSANAWLGGKTIPLNGGGVLKPM